MTTEQLVKVALSYRGMTQAELAKKIGMTPANFNARLKRNSFRREDMEAMAAAMDMEFIFTFKMKDGTMI